MARSPLIDFQMQPMFENNLQLVLELLLSQLPGALALHVSQLEHVLELITPNIPVPSPRVRSEIFSEHTVSPKLLGTSECCSNMQFAFRVPPKKKGPVQADQGK